MEYYIESALQILSANHVTADKLYIYSDGCSAQYKSKGPFKKLAGYNVPAERHYFGSEHGKSEADGESSVVKRSADIAVKSRQVVIQSAKDMYQWASDNLKLNEPSSKRDFIYVDRDQIPRIPEDLTTVKGTRKMHQVANIPGNKFQLKVRNLSCFCEPCQDQNQDRNLQCTNAAYVEKFQVVTIQKERAETEGE